MMVNIFAAGGPFRSMMEISQLKGDFTGGFATHLAAVKWALEAAKWHTCA